MSVAEAFFDTNVLLYLYSNDTAKADRVEELLADRGTISVQVLNEFASVALRKFHMPLGEVRETLDTIRALCRVESVTAATHDRGLDIHERYGFALYESLLLAAAQLAAVTVFYTEDLQDGQVIDGKLRLVNPFLHR